MLPRRDLNPQQMQDFLRQVQQFERRQGGYVPPQLANRRGMNTGGTPTGLGVLGNGLKPLYTDPMGVNPQPIMNTPQQGQSSDWLTKLGLGNIFGGGSGTPANTPWPGFTPAQPPQYTQRPGFAGVRPPKFNPNWNM